MFATFLFQQVFITLNLTAGDKGAQLSGKRFALGSQRFPVRVQMLAMFRGELTAVIARLMSKCL